MVNGSSVFSSVIQLHALRGEVTSNSDNAAIAISFSEIQKRHDDLSFPTIAKDDFERSPPHSLAAAISFFEIRKRCDDLNVSLILKMCGNYAFAPVAYFFTYFKLKEFKKNER